ncbi:hypothetical protein HF521_015846 [Silurus meridionalis]|uniref:Uncharacterized protein n=1 Tax=Silurus meridionalis TaxID=175797 RepID=A0A8T0A7P1_SILME|nr:hypothetical protein HF521_015846 [Silurus meridionalis]
MMARVTRPANDPARAASSGERVLLPGDAATITHRQFLQEYAYSKPVILRGLTDNTKFRFLCSKQSLLKEYQDKTIDGGMLH